MKFRIVLLSTLLALFSVAQAQFVTIPDPVFVSFLQTNYPSCMSGNQMDTTCSAITTAIVLDMVGNNITDGTGIQYFDAIIALDARSNLLTTLPRLPANLVSLKLSTNNLTSLPALPAGLVELQVVGNQLTTLPSLPSSLVSIFAGANPFVSFPPLPAALTEIDIQGCNLSVLPAFPTGLKTMIVATNPIGALPALPPTLEILSASSCQLSSLPPLPPTLKNIALIFNNLTALPPALPPALQSLNVMYNQITVLPPLPTGLQELHVQYNQLTTLPNLPAGMLILNAYNNSLSSVPNLPSSLTTADVSNNQITCFPPFPQGTSLNVNALNNPFTCVPNYPQTMLPTIGTVPICTTGNIMGCPSGEGVGGTVYQDLNADCILNGLDVGIANIPIKVYDNMGMFVQAGSSHPGGSYFSTLGAGTWTVSLDTAAKPFTAICPQPGVDSTVSLSLSTPLVQDVHFDVACKPGFDIGVTGAFHGAPFPGQLTAVRLLAGDISHIYGLHCSAGVAGQVMVTISGPATYAGMLPNALTPTVSGNTITYNIPDFDTLETLTDLAFQLLTLTSATIGDTICLDISVTPTLGDNNTANNSYQVCLPVTNSLDPNAKDVYPTSVSAGYADWLNYTVHFQNTGTAATFNIHVEDTLDANLDWASLEILAASHTQTWTLMGNALDVHFANIMLPDSNSNPAGSQGWFMYRVKPKANLPQGTVIPNSAAIYFDFNAPVITNTATTSYNLVTGARDQVNAAAVISVFPNPSAGIFQVEYPAHWKRADWSVTNLMGQELLHHSASSGGFAVDLAAQPAGFYLLKVSDGRSQIVRQLVKR